MNRLSNWLRQLIDEPQDVSLDVLSRRPLAARGRVERLSTIAGGPYRDAMARVCAPQANGFADPLVSK